MNRTFHRLAMGLLVLLLLVTACAPATQPPATQQAPAQPTAPEAQAPTAAPTTAPAAPAPTQSAGGETGEVVNLTMWDIPESEPYTAWWEDHVAQWNDANPNIQVKMEVFETEPYKTKLIGALASGTSADIFYQFAGGESYKAFQEGKALALDDLLDVDRFTEVGLSSCRVGDQVVCMPLYVAPALWYYNKAMFQEAGVDPTQWANPLQPTWEEFLAACEALKTAGFVPIALGNGDSWPGMMIYAGFANRIGGNEAFYDAIRGENGGSYTSESFVRAGEYVQELNNKGYFPEGYNGIGGEQKYALFTQEQGAMIFQGSWMLGYIKNDAPEGFEFGFFNIPSFPDGNPDSQQDVMGGVDALWIAASSQNPEAAGTFLNSFADPEVAASFATETENISVVKGVMEALPQESTIAQMAKILESAPHIIPWWDVELPAPVTEELMNSMQPLFAAEITPEEFGGRLQEAAAR